MSQDIALSAQARRTTDQPINYYMEQAVTNPRLISLAAGLVDPESLPVADVREALSEALTEPAVARSALQYGTTQGYAPLRDRLARYLAKLDGIDRPVASAEDVVVSTGSQQLLFLLGEALLDSGDIVITEAPSYFVNHGVLESHGASVRAVSMDDGGMDMDALEDLLRQLDRSGELDRVKLIYTCDYFQNPSGRTLALERRPRLVELARRFSRRHRLLILEDAAYRELGFGERGLPSVKSFDEGNRHVIYAGTFSKSCSPGVKTGWSAMPRDLVPAVLRLKGIHDFGSANLTQHLLDRFMASGAYDRHVARLKLAYRSKCQVLLEALEAHFGGIDGATWTRPEGGMFVWLKLEGHNTGPKGRLLNAALQEGMLYVPGEFCHVPDANGRLPQNEMRLCFGFETIDRIREAVGRLRVAVNRIVRHVA